MSQFTFLKAKYFLDLYELKQFVAFSELGTLSKVAEKFHISTPSITRSMKHLEESFGVTLFSRGKNRIELNETGKIAILPFPLENSREFMYENLFVSVPADHELAAHQSLTFSEINGFNFLLQTELGFGDTLCREKMSASKFLVQTDEDAFEELVRASSLPCFSTDYGRDHNPGYSSRINIPLTDPEAHVTFYITRYKI